MKKLSEQATRIFNALIAGLAPGEARRIDNSPGVYMPVSVDVVLGDGSWKLVAVAHRFEQNGDLCPDPDVEFLVNADGVFPVAIDQYFGYTRAAVVSLDGTAESVRPSHQADITNFCNGWMLNIARQQGIVGAGRIGIANADLRSVS